MFYIPSPISLGISGGVLVHPVIISVLYSDKNNDEA
jgi:hypothetical protein